MKIRCLRETNCTYEGGASKNENDKSGCKDQGTPSFNNTK